MEIVAPEEFVSIADNRLYKAKNKGRNQTVVEDESFENAREGV